MVDKSPSKLSTKYPERPCAIFTAQMQQGIVLAFAAQTSTNMKAAFVKPIIKQLSDPSAASDANVDHICFRRLTTGVDEKMHDKPGSPYGFYQFIRVHEDEENNTAEKTAKWGKKLATRFTEIAREHFQYPKRFKFVDVTEVKEGNLPTADKYLLNLEM